MDLQRGLEKGHGTNVVSKVNMNLQSDSCDV